MSDPTSPEFSASDTQKVICTGRGGTHPNRHCCYVQGKVCEFLIEDHKGRRFACGLMAELGSWDKVHADPRYALLAIHWKGQPLCGDWQPKPGTCCLEVH